MLKTIGKRIDKIENRFRANTCPYDQYDFNVLSDDEHDEFSQLLDKARIKDANGDWISGKSGYEYDFTVLSHMEVARLVSLIGKARID